MGVVRLAEMIGNKTSGKGFHSFRSQIHAPICAAIDLHVWILINCFISFSSKTAVFDKLQHSGRLACADRSSDDHTSITGALCGEVSFNLSEKPGSPNKHWVLILLRDLKEQWP